MNKIQMQIAHVWHLLFSQETAATYQKALQLTWEIIKESGKLLWLFACLFLVIFAWGMNTSVKTGQSLRSWYDEIEEPRANHFMNEAGKALMLAGSTGANLAVSQAKNQLGIIEEKEPETIEVLAVKSEPKTIAQQPKSAPPTEEDI